MKRFPLLKLLLFIFIVLPVVVLLFVFFFVPLIIILLLCMPLLAKRFVFRTGNFRKAPGREEENHYDASSEEGEIVDVEGVVVDSSIEEESSSSQKMLSSGR